MDAVRPLCIDPRDQVTITWTSRRCADCKENGGFVYPRCPRCWVGWEIVTRLFEDQEPDMPEIAETNGPFAQFLDVMLYSRTEVAWDLFDPSAGAKLIGTNELPEPESFESEPERRIVRLAQQWQARLLIPA